MWSTVSLWVNTNCVYPLEDSKPHALPSSDVTSLSPSSQQRRPSSSPTYVRFVMNKLALEQIFLQVLWSSSVSIVPPVLYFFMAQQPPSGPEPPHCRGFTITPRHTTVGRTPLDEWSARRRDLYLTTQHTDTPQSVGLLWTSDQPKAETSTVQHNTLTTDIYAPGGIQTHNPSKRWATGFVQT